MKTGILKTMASILLRTILHGGRQVRLYLASKGNGYQRLPEVMDKKILKEVGDRVEQEIEQFPDNTAEIEIRHDGRLET